MRDEHLTTNGTNGTNGHPGGNGHHSSGYETRPLQVDDLPEGLDPIDTAFAYAQHLSAEMRRRVQKFHRLGVDLREELALVRCVAADAVQSYAAAERACEDAQLDENKRMAVRAAAGALVFSAMREVRDTALAAHRVLSRDGIDPQALQAILFAAVQVFDRKFQGIAPKLLEVGVDPKRWIDEAARELDERVGVDLASPDALGTKLTPEQLDCEVEEMLGSVPGAAG